MPPKKVKSAAGAATATPAGGPTIDELLASLSVQPEAHESMARDAYEPDSEEARWIARGAHPSVQRILAEFPSGNALGEAAINIIKLQLALRKKQVDADRALVLNEGAEEVRTLDLPSNRAAKDSSKQSSLFAQAAKSLASRFGQSPQSDRELLDELSAEHAAVIRRAVSYWTRLPFPVVVELQQSTSKDEADIDEWIITNEHFMRARLSVSDAELAEAATGTGDAASDSASKSRASKAKTAAEPTWKSWLVRLGSTHADILFGKATGKAGHHTLQRPKQLSGLCLLDKKREDSIRLRTLASFTTQWNRMTENVLKGLDWSNVFVGGGMVMGALTGSFDNEGAEFYKDSDIDIYIHGLTSEEATAKVLHIEEVFAKNVSLLPKAKAEGMAYAVLRNSKTISLIPQYPHRRVQIILKICTNPMEALLNFDLDQVAMGYDGTNVWMLPRAARALKTGYTTFTMDLIQGHYLNDRRATQDARIFKYADRGYGIRFLEAYVDAVKDIAPQEFDKDIYRQRLLDAVETLLDAVETLPPPSEQDRPKSLLHDLLDEARNKTDWSILQNGRVAHSGIDGREMIDASVGFGCLANFEAFARHVALAELGHDGVVDVPLHFTAESYYEEDADAYYDGPDYKWNEEFTLLGLKDIVQQHGAGDASRFFNALGTMGVVPETHWSDNDESRSKRRKAALDNLVERPYLQRIIWSTSVEWSLKQKLVSAVYAPDSFIEFARSILPESKTQLQDAIVEPAKPTSEKAAEYSMVYWENDFTWQLVDRVKDEVIEMLHAFRRAHAAHPQSARSQREQHAVRQISRRAPRPTREAELNAFSAWAGRPNRAFTSGYQNNDEWQMWGIPRKLANLRFSLPIKTLMEFSQQHYLTWVDSEDVKESTQWWRASARKEQGVPLPYPTGVAVAPTAKEDDDVDAEEGESSEG